MDSYTWLMRVHSRHQFASWMSAYLDGLMIRNEEDGTSLLSGELPDMAAVYGLIMRLRDGDVDLISLEVRRSNNSNGGTENE